MSQLVKFEQFLWEGDDISMEAWHACSEMLVSPQVTHADLHMAKCYEHCFCDSRNARQFHPLFVRRSLVQAKQWIPIILGRENGNIFEQRVGFYFLGTLVAALTDAVMNRGVARWMRWRRRIPVMDIDGTTSQALQFKIRLIRGIFMPRWEALVAAPTMEEDHVAEDALHPEHPSE